jgi:hypothetical protein
VFQTSPGASFIVNGATAAKNSALASGTELRLANGVTLLAKFDGEFTSHSSPSRHRNAALLMVVRAAAADVSFGSKGAQTISASRQRMSASPQKRTLPISFHMSALCQ